MVGVFFFCDVDFRGWWGAFVMRIFVAGGGI